MDFHPYALQKEDVAIEKKYAEYLNPTQALFDALRHVLFLK